MIDQRLFEPVGLTSRDYTVKYSVDVDERREEGIGGWRWMDDQQEILLTNVIEPCIPRNLGDVGTDP